MDRGLAHGATGSLGRGLRAGSMLVRHHQYFVVRIWEGAIPMSSVLPCKCRSIGSCAGTL